MLRTIHNLFYYSRDYDDDDLFERDISFDDEPLFARELTDDIDLEAREPRVRISNGARKFFGGIKRLFFGREVDEDDLLSRDYTFEEDLD